MSSQTGNPSVWLADYTPAVAPMEHTQSAKDRLDRLREILDLAADTVSFRCGTPEEHDTVQKVWSAVQIHMNALRGHFQDRPEPNKIPLREFLYQKMATDIIHAIKQKAEVFAFLKKFEPNLVILSPEANDALISLPPSPSFVRQGDLWYVGRMQVVVSDSTLEHITLALR